MRRDRAQQPRLRLRRFVPDVDQRSSRFLGNLLLFLSRTIFFILQTRLEQSMRSESFGHLSGRFEGHEFPRRVGFVAGPVGGV
jgi:hypothetical protein